MREKLVAFRPHWIPRFTASLFGDSEREGHAVTHDGDPLDPCLSTGARVRDRGSGTVAILGAVGVLLVMTVGTLSLVSAVVAAHRAQSAADLAALAAAGALTAGETPGAACGRGAAVASRNGASLATCRAGPDLSIELVVEVRVTVARLGVAVARARAGPAGNARAVRDARAGDAGVAAPYTAGRTGAGGRGPPTQGPPGHP